MNNYNDSNKEFIYSVNFHLKNDVLSISDANEYLQEDDMTNYLKKDLNNSKFTELQNNIIKIYWEIITSNSGKISLITNKKLSKEELDYISQWINSQNSDGIGEGFEQQDFASYTERSEYIYNAHNNVDYNYADNLDDSYLIIASFDWEDNNYKLELE